MNQVEIAKRLGVSKNAVSQYKNGTVFFGVKTALKVAELLELDPLQVVLDAEIDRNRDPATTRELTARYFEIFGKHNEPKKKGENLDIYQLCA